MLKMENTGKYLMNKHIRVEGSKLICLQLFKIRAVSLVPIFRKLSKNMPDSYQWAAIYQNEFSLPKVF